jgi:hypothetical protein
MSRPVSLDRALARLVKQYDHETVAARLREITTTPRPLGRPPGPHYDDTRLAQTAAAQWRQAGRRAAVWRALLEAGGSESVARRVLYRLDEWGAEGCAERHIADFYAALEAARVKRSTDKFVALLLARQIANGKQVTAQEIHHWLAHILKGIHQVLDSGDRVCFRGFGTFEVGPDGKKEIPPQPPAQSPGRNRRP